jgi:superfamily II DNA or RNA helicase
MVKKYDFTPEERHHMMLELAFFIHPFSLSDDLGTISAASGIPQSHYKQFVDEAALGGELCSYQEQGLYTYRSAKTYYYIPYDRQIQLLLEVRDLYTHGVAPFGGRTAYAQGFRTSTAQRALQEFFLTEKFTLFNLLQLNDFDWVFVARLPFYAPLRPFFSAQSEDVQQLCFLHLLAGDYLHNVPAHYDLHAAYLDNPNIEESLRDEFWRQTYAYLYVPAGRFSEIPNKLLGPETWEGLLLCAVVNLYKGAAGIAIDFFQAALKQTKSKYFSRSTYDVLYVTALMRDGSAASMKKLDVLSHARDIQKDAQHYPIRLLLSVALNSISAIEFSEFEYSQLSGETAAWALIIARHFHIKGFNHPESHLAEWIDTPGFRLLQLEASADFPRYKAKADELAKQVGFQPILAAYEAKPEWEKVIDRILSGGLEQGQSRTRLAPVSSGRVVYLVNSYKEIIPVLQKSKDGVTWSGGRHIALKNFVSGIPEMSDFDHKMAHLVRKEEVGWYGNTTYRLGGSDALAALAGHPLVFSEENPSIPVSITKEPLQLTVTKTPKGYVVQDNAGDAHLSYPAHVVQMDTPYSIRIVELTPQQRELLPVLHKVDLFPKVATPRLTQLLHALSKTITIHSDLIAPDSAAETVAADTHLTLQLQPVGEGVRAEVYVKPIAGHAPYCRPGKGSAAILGTCEGRPVRADRDLKAEQQHLEQFLTWVTPILGDSSDSASDLSYYCPDPQSVLSLLESLQAHTDEVLIEWPQGAKYNLCGKVDFQQVSLRSKGVSQWFELEGEVNVGEDKIVTLTDLLAALRQNPANRFIQISDGEFVALTDRLRSQLAALDGVLQTDKKHARIPTLAVGVLSALEQAGTKLKKDRALKQLQERISEAENSKFPVPAGLQAELRDYQVQGFRWMARLAMWGAGACLADDMGLGKTLQSIALLLERAKQGPALVVVPTSVLLNWVSELERFAPQLHPVVLHDARGDRARLVADTQPFDVLLTTYGILAKEVETLTSRTWSTLVLDEAHTIKNRDTKMSRAAMQLPADARVLLTGTPLQNNLSELWTLFQCANPGLLGDFSAFTAKFLNPIEKQDDADRRRQLKQLLRPFILRRTKTEVLDELPEKTEITLRVDLSTDERALYESLRRQAIDNLSGATAQPGGSAAIQALAEITKLRQAACNPALVNPELPIASSKTAAFCDLVDELIAGHHRALVFSQFTSHLALIRAALDARKIDYLYLDGATTSAQRARLVRKFQEGETPLFLISLKAGGLGLNLTAADYVIHLDPWWNPAIEDQASDRAYRMGQTRPVTVYRLIAADTIEEKILRLHQTKKALADTLLSGTDRIQRLSADEILALLREA